MARKPLSMTLTTASKSNAKIEAGRIHLTPGCAARAMVLKTTFLIANASGGPVTLSKAQKLAVLDNFKFNVKWGSPKKPQKMFLDVGARKMREIARTLFGTELQGFIDTVDGMQTALPDAATTAIILYQRIPLGHFWRLLRPDLLAFGRSQCATLEIEAKFLNDTVILAGVTFGGDVTMELMPDELRLANQSDDPVSPGIVYDEADDAGKKATLPQGLPLQVTERSAAHASSALSNVTVKVGNTTIHEQVSAEELITEFTDVPNVPADAATTDEVTHLYDVNGQGGSMNPAELPTGEVTVEQNTKNLSIILLSQLRVPVLSKEEVEDFVGYAATSIIKGKRKAVSTNLAWKLGFKPRSAFAAPFLLVDETSSLFQRLPGPVGGPGLTVDTVIPESAVAKVKAQVHGHRTAGEPAAAEEAVQELAAAIPGAVNSADGFQSGDTSLLDRVRRAIG